MKIIDLNQKPVIIQEGEIVTLPIPNTVIPKSSLGLNAAIASLKDEKVRLDVESGSTFINRYLK